MAKITSLKLDRRILLAAIPIAVLLMSAFIPSTPLPAADAGNGKGKGSANNVGKHEYKINVIGRPNEWSGKDYNTNSKVLFIGIKTYKDHVECEDESGVYLVSEFVEAPEPGQRIYFYEGDKFGLEDRDASDGKAVVTIPYSEDGYDIAVRILGGSNKNFPACLDADAYQYTDTDLYYYIGHLDANRKPGQPEKVNVKSLFYGNGNEAYYSDYYEDYFWTIQNNGLRNMQVIFY
ncbi:MAG: hypothetical protein ACE5J2_09060 [Nitrososphaerales archaeon]